MQGIFAGRERELGLLIVALESAMGGRPRMVVCLGETGMGKSRLARELAEGVRERGVRVVAWPCADAGAPPLWPWRQIAATLARDGVPGAAEVLAACDGVGEGEPSFAARARLFDQVSQLLRDAAYDEGLLVLLDDLDEADDATLSLLHQVVRGLEGERLLVVATARQQEARLQAVVREPNVQLLDVHALDAEATGAIFLDAVGRPPSPDEIAALTGATGGNPLFVSEIARSVATGRSVSELPASLSDVIAARLAALSAEVRDCLEAGAVQGLEFDVALVGDGDRVATCCAQAVKAGLVRPAEGQGRFRFVHAVVHAAVLAGLGDRRMRELHRRAAEALTARAEKDDAVLFQLAEHWIQAGPAAASDRAARWVERAGRAAMRVHAYRDAQRLFAAALDLAPVDPADPSDPSVLGYRCRVELDLASAAWLSDDVRTALSLARTVFDRAVAAGELELATDAVLIAQPTFDFDIDRQTRSLCEAALAVPGLRTTDRARVLAAHALVCDYMGDIAQSVASVADAMRLVEQTTDDRALRAVLVAHQMVRSGPDGLAERERAAERLEQLGRRTGDAHDRLTTAEWRFDLAAERGDLAACARELHAIARFAGDLGGPIVRWRRLRCEAMLAQAQGRLRDARRLGEQALRVVSPTGFPEGFLLWAGFVAILAHHSGHDAAALSADGLGDEDATLSDWPTVGVVLTLSPAYQLIEVGRMREARDIYRRLGPATDWIEIPHARLFTWALGIAAAARLGQDQDVVTLRDRLAPFRGHHIVNGRHAMAYFGPAELWLGVAAAHLGLLDDAASDLELAVKACTANGAESFRAEAELELAVVLVRRCSAGDTARARLLAAAAGRTADRLGASPLVERAGALVAAIDSHPSRRLTAREAEVARLVAERLTNPEIAARLHLSQRTAQNHVQHILDKLQLHSRDQIAAWWQATQMSTPGE